MPRTINPVKYTHWFVLLCCICIISSVWCGLAWSIYPWASFQIQKIAGCACAGNAGYVFPATYVKGNRQLTISACITARAWRTCRDAFGIANSRSRGKRSRRMRNPQFCVSGKRLIFCCVAVLALWSSVIRYVSNLWDCVLKLMLILDLESYSVIMFKGGNSKYKFLHLGLHDIVCNTEIQPVTYPPIV